MLYLITEADYFFLLKKKICLRLYNLKAELIIFVIELRNFNKNIKYNLLIKLV